MVLVRQLVYGVHDVYKDFDCTKYTLDLQGWNGNHPIFESLIRLKKPLIIIEVGTWKGQSAVSMANQVKRYCRQENSEIICVDTWVGSIEYWRCNIDLLNLKNGFPQIYSQFLANVVLSGHQDIITPLPMTSSMAAQYLSHLNLFADMIYIDAGHDYFSVKADLEAYFPLLSPHGILFGDDYDPSWKGGSTGGR